MQKKMINIFFILLRFKLIKLFARKINMICIKLQEYQV